MDSMGIYFERSVQTKTGPNFVQVFFEDKSGLGVDMNPKPNNPTFQTLLNPNR